MSLSTAYTTRLIGTKEAAHLLGVTQRTVQNWIDNDAIPYIKLPSSGDRSTYRIPLGALLDAMSGTFDLGEVLGLLEQEATAAGLDEATIDQRLGLSA